MKVKLVIAFMIISVLFLISGCNQSEETTDEKKKETSTPVETEVVEHGNFYAEKSIYGRTAPEKQIPIMLEQPGELKTLNVENGDEVDEDDHIATIKTQMGEQEIKAPSDGIIASLDVSEDTIVSNEDPFMLIVTLEKVRANFAVTSSLRALFEKGDEVNVQVDNEKYNGEILAMDTLPDDTGQYPIKVEFDNKDSAVLPGMTAELVVKELIEKDTIIIPTAAVVTQEEGYVFIVDGEHAKRVNIEVLSTQSDKSAVKAKINEDDDIIVKGQHTLTDGSLIDVKEGNVQ